MPEPIFTLFEIPYFNALTAGEFDASSSFDANMPASHVAYSLQTLGLYQSPGQTIRPDVLKWDTPPAAGVREGPAPGECQWFEVDCHLNKFFSGETFKDYAKRTGLVVVAIILVVVAIISLR